MNKKQILMGAVAATCVAMAQTGFGFVAVTAPATVDNSKGSGNVLPGAQVGDSFYIPDGSFSSYSPAPGDPTITGNDLNFYQYTLTGHVTSVIGDIVDYTGTYTIFYDTTLDHSFDAGDFTLSSGNFTLQADFSTGLVAAADGVLTQTGGPSPGFPSAGFPEHQESFAGTYTQSRNPAIGTFSATIPDSTSTMALMGLASAGLMAVKRKFRA